ncbi:hypothetical protein SAMN05444682_103138 [Parapedobacter indicus]|uniref:Calcineurin-like phosphoesterase n=1 Tax=Parapedobacter indicus TaxID=1477437 RepID=A0A1I3GX83_9SPHI|nr:hypothetical protein CLV26_103139 [Parapedobacter indicus]SFI27937.1 hypothetical protein SAMN05444682_103138 [Parapedobacter indicus]
MKYVFRLVVGFVILNLIQCTTIEDDKSFFFFHMSDTQFGFFNKNEDYIQEKINVEKAISEANRLRPKFVIVTGDLVRIPGNSTQIVAYKTVADQMRVT